MPFNSDFVLEFYETLPGRYIIQTTVHSIIAVIIINSIRRSWNINSPVNLQRLHFIPIVQPPLMLVLYHILDPSRNSPERRLMALLDIERILAVQYRGISLGMLLLFSMILVSAIFLFQEILPVVKNILIVKREEEKRIINTIHVHIFDKTHEVNIIEDEEYIIFSSTGTRPSIFISSGLISNLSQEELQAALAHEAAHIIRSKRPALIGVYIFRIAMFFNPVALIEFRKAVQEEEKICDRMAQEWTGNPEALRSVLKKFLPEINEKAGLNRASHELLIIERLTGLMDSGRQGKGFLTLVLAIISTGVINYFII